jgi:hypothetical protein
MCHFHISDWKSPDAINIKSSPAVDAAHAYLKALIVDICARPNFENSPFATQLANLAEKKRHSWVIRPSQTTPPTPGTLQSMPVESVEPNIPATQFLFRREETGQQSQGSG